MNLRNRFIIDQDDKWVRNLMRVVLLRKSTTGSVRIAIKRAKYFAKKAKNEH